MKIIAVTAATNTIPRFRIDMLELWVEKGAEVLVLGDEPESEWSNYFENRNIRYRSYYVSRNGLNPLADAKTFQQLKTIFLKEKPDKVFTYQAKPNIYGCLAAHSAGISELYVMMGGLGSVFHATDMRSRIIKRIVSFEYKNALKHAKHIFFQNSDDVKTFEDARIINSEQVVMVRGSGVNLDQFKQQPLPETPSFLFVGRLVEGKGVLDYLNAARIVKKAHPEASFHLVGPFDSNPTAISPEQLQPYIEEGTVIYHGEQKDVRPFLKACSVFVLPSYYGEGTPKSALEAMATGRALIVADAVGCREVVENGINGYLVKSRAPSSLAMAMNAFIKDSNLASKMGSESRKKAKRIFDVRKVNSVICDAMGLGKSR